MTARRSIVLALTLMTATGAAGGAMNARRLQDAWEIDTGAVRCVIDDRNYVRSLALPGGRELMAEGGGYWDVVYLLAGADNRNGNYSRFGHHLPATPRMVRCDDEIIHLALETDESGRDPQNPLHVPLQIEAHYIFTPGLQGFYFFAVLRHTDALPDIVLHQVRHLMRCNPKLFTHWRLSNGRAGELAPWDQFQQAETIADATFQLPNGRIVTKYQMLRELASGPVYGITGDDGRVGLWVVEPSKGYHTGGPTKQNLTIQNGALLLNEPLNGHAMGPDTYLPISGQWARVYGPWLYLVSNADTHESQWQQALAHARLEERAWPWEWCAETVGEALYPLQRATVEGRVLTSDGTAASDAWAILGRPGEDWQSDSDGWRYWTRSDANGRFRIERVRPGTYDLSAWREGDPREARVGPLHCAAGETMRVDDLALPKVLGETIWAVGTPDRAALEFRRGDDFRHWNILRFYPDDFPDDVRFVVGKSTERDHWNIAQPGPTVLDNGDRAQHPWTIEFDLDRPTDSLLTIGVADSSYHPPAGVAISVNGADLPELSLEPGDSAAYRCAAWGRYQVHDVPIEADSLQRGMNTIALTLPHRNSWVMYDFISLHTGEAVQ